MAADVIATTRAALIRGTTTTDELGDEITTDEPVAKWADFAATITERSQIIFDAASGEQRTVRHVRATVPPTLPVEDGDRLRDNRTGKLYAIEENTLNLRTIAGRRTLRLDLRDTRG